MYRDIKKISLRRRLIFAGINYGTAPLILSHFNKEYQNINFYFIDPFDGTKNQIVNLDPIILKNNCLRSIMNWC
jgi:hypothetical protein